MGALKYAAFVLFCASLLSGCVPGGKPPYTVQLYTLEYSSPSPFAFRLDEVVRIDRFSVAQSNNTSAMLFRPQPHKVASYNYHRWHMNPGDMVTEHLLGDFRNANLFHAVLSYRDQEDSRFVVSGTVEEFLQASTVDGWQAVLSVQVTLLDTNNPGSHERILFQKRYRNAEPLTKESPEEFAGGMSRAMSKVSAAILNDVSASVKVRIDNGLR
jgi:ABC-type uncharacterized transport system auxiliary subunit